MSENRYTSESARAVPLSGFIYLLFFGSGASGLIYEVVWTRQLTYLFGATIYAVATVLAAFMGGLALGSYGFGKIADRTARPLRLYAGLELGVAGAALILPFLLHALNPIFLVVYRSFESTFLVYSLLRFAMTFLILLIPTTLMGGTLPVLSRFIVRRRDCLGLRVGSLYSVNTLGAVLGCFLAGFFLIATLGVRATTLLAACVNMAVGAVALALSWRFEQPSEPLSMLPEKQTTAPTEFPPGATPDEQLYSPAQVRWVLGVYFLSGFAALAYEVAWTRALVFTFEEMKNTTYAFTTMLSVFLIGIALGSAFSSRIVDRERDPLRLFAFLQVLIGLSGVLSFFIIYYQGYALNPFAPFDPQTKNIIWWGAVGNVFAKTIAGIFLPTFLMGMAFPVAAKVCVASLGRVGSEVGKLYSLNTIGAILGSFAAGFLLIPYLGIARTIAALALLNVFLGVIVFSINPRISRDKKAVLSLGGGVIALVLFLRVPGETFFEYLSPTESLLFYEEGPLATVSVVKNSFGYKTLDVDNVGVAGTDRIMLTDQKSLAHIPMLLLREPRSALTVGFGSGGASWSFTRYASLKRIDCVEICCNVAIRAIA
jgi:spermidine synthase